MILAVTLTLLLQDTAELQNFRASADKLTERLQSITGTLKDLREKRRVHLEALAEVEAYLGTINRTGTDIQAKARQLEDLKRAFDAKQKEYDDREREYEGEKKLYDQQLERFNTIRKDLNARMDRTSQEIRDHNARENQVTADQVEAYRKNAERLNAAKAANATENSRVEGVDRPALNAAWDKLERKNVEFRAVQDVYFDLDSEFRKEVRGFRSSIRSMEGPTEALYSLLQEATGKRTASMAYRVFGRRMDAEAISLAAAFGSSVDLPDGPFAQVLIIRSAHDRAATRDYIVEKLRLGEIIETLRGLSTGSAEKPVAADRVFEYPSLAGQAAKPSALVKGATWTTKPADPAKLKAQTAPGLR